MKARLKVTKRLENGTIIRCEDKIVEFICITTDRSAKIIDNGKPKTVRRTSLMDVPQSILYPDIPIIAPKIYDNESIRKAFYYD